MDANLQALPEALWISLVMDEATSTLFGATRAADYTDEEIHQYWVDLADDGGFFDLVKPRSTMPMIILGGKGSGKTHMMRYLSFALQQIRHAPDLSAGIAHEGYLGIYMRCSGLNSTRFRDKGQSEEVWASVFAYYMELWLGQLVLETFRQLFVAMDDLPVDEGRITSQIREFFDTSPDDFPKTLAGVRDYLRALQRELDLAVNNCVIDRTLNVRIRVTPGRLVFGLPRVLLGCLPSGHADLVVYLIDEFENLTGSQQKFVNTLLRERESPCSFKVGARLYGIRTYSTYCADEENKEGSEYERLPLDQRLRRDEKRYASFARRLVVKRLAARGVIGDPPTTDARMAEVLSRAFEQPSTEGVAVEATQFVIQKYQGRDRPYFKSLRQSLEQGLRGNVAPGVGSRSNIDRIVRALECSQVPLLEKLNCFSFYQAWSAQTNLLEAADSIGQACRDYLRDKDHKSSYHDRLLHFKSDLLAQLRRDCGQKQQYVGFHTLVDLSWGNPRHLLILLKHVLSWAAFKNEEPFCGKPISTAAQVAGVKEAADWFFRDARMTGRDGKLVHDAISRLGTLFRSVRYSDKPPECSVATFSFESSAVTAEAQRLMQLAEQWSLLVYVGGQRDRNSERIDAKLQVNRMLAPLWDIAISRRGVLPLSGDDVNAIFDPKHTTEFDTRLKVRVGRMNAPFRPQSGATQSTLPGLSDG